MVLLQERESVCVSFRERKCNHEFKDEECIIIIINSDAINYAVYKLQRIGSVVLIIIDCFSLCN